MAVRKRVENRSILFYRQIRGNTGKFTASIVALVLVLIPFFSLTFALFTSLPAVFAATAAVNLGTADDFGVLAGSAITDTGTTAITGDVGLDPTGGAAITGLTCDEVTGTIYDNDGGYTGGGGGSTACRSTNTGLLTTAKDDLTTAYNDAAGRTTTSTVGTELGGTTLTDGVYDSAAGTFGITGTLTLDGGGNADSVFIFKMASTLITASSSQVVLTNGAQACNVYWQVGSSATLGTSTSLVGNVLALTSITDDGSSTVNGRLLARNGAVTLQNTTIEASTCATATPTPSATPADGGSSGSSGGSSASSGGTKDSPVLDFIAPIIIESRRVDADSIYISWGPYSGIDTFVVQYGLENGTWPYNTNVTGFSTTINALPPNQPVWVRVAATDGHSVGTYGEATLVGGPKLPNTGYGARRRNALLYSLAVILTLAPLLPRIIRVRVKK